jgi:predicted nucleic acid-binding protein
VLYVDASALVKRYVEEEADGGGAMMDAVVSNAARWGGIASSEWLILEVTSALTKKLRGLKITRQAFDRHLRRFREDTRGLLLIPVQSQGINGASRLMESLPSLDRFHSGDAIHLQTAIQLRDDIAGTEPLVFVTTDPGLQAVAARHNIQLFDPRTDTLEYLESLTGR